MREYIFNFNQKNLVNLNISLADALILDYLIKFIENGTSFVNKGGKKFMWVSNKKILEDLPILNIEARTLRRILLNLENAGIILRKVIKSKSYIHINKNILFFEQDQNLEESFTAKDKETLKNFSCGQKWPGFYKNSKNDVKNGQGCGQNWPTIVYYYKNKIKIITLDPRVQNVDKFTFLKTLKKELSKNMSSLSYELSAKNLDIVLIDENLIILKCEVASILEKNYSEVFNNAVMVAISEGYNFAKQNSQNTPG